MSQQLKSTGEINTVPDGDTQEETAEVEASGRAEEKVIKTLPADEAVIIEPTPVKR